MVFPKSIKSCTGKVITKIVLKTVEKSGDSFCWWIQYQPKIPSHIKCKIMNEREKKVNSK